MRRGGDPRLVVLAAATFAVLAGVVVGMAARWPTAGVVVSFVLVSTAAVVAADDPRFRSAARRFARRVAAGVRSRLTGDDPPRLPAESGVGSAESHLRRAELLVDGEDGGPRVDPAFERAWRRRIVSMGDRSEDAAALADLLSVPRREVELSWEADDGTLVASVRGRPAGRWPSRAAFLADVTAVEAFRARFPEWWEFDPATRTRVLAALRLCLDWCPTCDGAVSLSRTDGDDRIEARRTAGSDAPAGESVLAATCDGCAARLFETALDPMRFDRSRPRDAEV